MLMLRVLFGVVIAVVAARTAIAGPFEDATAAYQQGDYATPMRLVRPLSEQGMAEAQGSLALLYENGQGVSQDYTEAAKWFREAATRGGANAQDLGSLYASGQGVAQDFAEAENWFRKATDQGDPWAQGQLALMHVNGGRPDELESIRLQGLSAAEPNAPPFAKENVSDSDQAQDSRDVSDITFAMPPFWVIGEPAIRKGDLIFRRYSLVFPEPESEAALTDAGIKMTYDENAGFPNTMMFFCRRTPKYNDVVVVHIPDGMSITGIKPDAWISEVNIHLLADDTAYKLIGEFIKGDLFMDLAQGTIEEVQSLLSAKNIKLDVGDEKGRVNLIVTDSLGSAQISGFMKDMFAAKDSPFPRAQKFLSTAEMFKQCEVYKKTGRY